MRTAASPCSGDAGSAAYTTGDYAAARDIGERLLEAARSSEDSGRLVEAHHALWATFTAMGAPTAAIPHAERGVALYVRERHASQMFTYGGHDPGACCRYQLAFDLWLIGRPDRALASLRDAQRLATELQHPLTETVTLWFASWVYYQRGDRHATIEAAERLQSLAQRAWLHTLDGRRRSSCCPRPVARRIDRRAVVRPARAAS